MDFLRFTLHLIDFLAWQVVALGYPICVSIRAIETGSKYHMRKLVIYWTIFSFISLFQHLFDKLIQWVPLWPHIKLITICWLVIPQFNGACYLYEILIRPYFLVKWHDIISQSNSSCHIYLRLLCLYLSVNLQTVTDWFNKPMEDQSLNNETSLAMVERYPEEDGSDPLEKLIGNKYKDYSLNHHAEEVKFTDNSDEAEGLTPNQAEREESVPVWEDITVMEHMAKHEAAEPKQVKSVKENPIQIEKKTTGVQVKVKSVKENPIQIEKKMTGGQFKEMVLSAVAEEIKLPKTNSVKNVQTKWTCAVCQVTTSSKHDLTCHLRGRRHREKCEELNTFKRTAKTKRNPRFTSNMPELKQEQVKHAHLQHNKNSSNEKPKEKVQLGATTGHIKGRHK